MSRCWRTSLNALPLSSTGHRSLLRWEDFRETFTIIEQQYRPHKASTCVYPNTRVCCHVGHIRLGWPVWGIWPQTGKDKQTGRTHTYEFAHTVWKWTTSKISIKLILIPAWSRWAEPTSNSFLDIEGQLTGHSLRCSTKKKYFLVQNNIIVSSNLIVVHATGCKNR